MRPNRFLNVLLSFGRTAISRRMIEQAHAAGLRVTHHFHLDTLRDARLVGELKAYRDKYGDEIALWISADAELLANAGVEKPQRLFRFYPFETKKRLARAMVKLFEQTLGQKLEAITHFNLDADSLAALKAAAPGLICAMPACFEEGLRIARGHRYFDVEWVNFCEGGPWWPWIPRRDNSNVPAGPGDERVDLVCVPHLNRDLMMAYEGRCDFYSTQPMDLMRSKSVRPDDISYVKRLLAQNLAQAKLNYGYAYYQFLETPSSCDPKVFRQVYDESPKQTAQVYARYIAYLGEQVRSGAISNVSMAEFGHWYWKRFKGATAPTAAHWKDIRFQSGKDYIWCLNPLVRALFSPTRGGAILDLRPYAANVVNRDGMADPVKPWDGNHPYLVQDNYRYTSIFKGMLRIEDDCIDLTEHALGVARVTNGDQGIVIQYRPKRLRIGTVSLLLTLSSRVTAKGDIETHWEIKEPSRMGVEIQLRQSLRGTWGTDDLPANLRGITLEVRQDKKRYGMPFNYSGRMVEIEGVNECRVVFPKWNFSASLVSPDSACTGLVTEGTLDANFYEMALTKRAKLADGLSFTTALRWNKGLVKEGKLDQSRCRYVPTPPAFKAFAMPHKHPLRCPLCLQRNNEIHLLREKGRYRCPSCSFVGTNQVVWRLYRERCS